MREGLEVAVQLLASCGVMEAHIDGSFVTDKKPLDYVDGCHDLAEGAITKDLTQSTPIFLPSLSGRPE